MKSNTLKSMIILSQTGCLLPTLIVLNLFFGWILFGLKGWLILELVLVALLVINSYIATRHFPSRKKDAIDVEAEVLDEKEKIE